MGGLKGEVLLFLYNTHVSLLAWFIHQSLRGTCLPARLPCWF